MLHDFGEIGCRERREVVEQREGVKGKVGESTDSSLFVNPLLPNDGKQLMFGLACDLGNRAA